MMAGRSAPVNVPVSAKSTATLQDHGLAVNELTEEQRAAFVAVSRGLYGEVSDIVKDKDFFDRTTALAKGS